MKSGFGCVWTWGNYTGDLSRKYGDVHGQNDDKPWVGFSVNFQTPLHIENLIQTGTGWWFGTWFLFFHILGIIIPTDFHIFQRGGYTTNQGRSWLTMTHLWPIDQSKSGTSAARSAWCPIQASGMRVFCTPSIRRQTFGWPLGILGGMCW